MIGHTCMNLCLARLCLFDTLDIDVCLVFAYLLIIFQLCIFYYDYRY